MSTRHNRHQGQSNMIPEEFQLIMVNNAVYRRKVTYQSHQFLKRGMKQAVDRPTTQNPLLSSECVMRSLFNIVDLASSGLGDKIFRESDKVEVSDEVSDEAPFRIGGSQLLPYLRFSKVFWYLQRTLFSVYSMIFFKTKINLPFDEVERRVS